MNKKQNSAATSKSGPRCFPRSEKEFLEHKADAAKAALSRAAHETAGEILTDLDPRAWTKKYPWRSTGIAVVAGFVAASTFRMPAEKQAEKPPENLPEKLEDGPRPARPEPRESSSLLGLVVAAGLDILKRALIPVVASEVSERLNRRS